MLYDPYLLEQVAQLSPLVFSLVEVIKMTGMPSRYAPLTSIVFGVGIALLAGVNPLVGVISALTASGLYAGAKKTAQG